ncbi:hypothetical protein RRG08_064972 [Elysia crispata]|uniref:Uncharacterized protein n=1 Tax=Elysia crispata TaxID=231223 RepID=A0AAE1CV52_9GAST|nr:hypothetical protein RRG08_064972 [Elysia crispata]
MRPLQRLLRAPNLAKVTHYHRTRAVSSGAVPMLPRCRPTSGLINSFELLGFLVKRIDCTSRSQLDLVRSNLYYGAPDIAQMERQTSALSSDCKMDGKSGERGKMLLRESRSDLRIRPAHGLGEQGAFDGADSCLKNSTIAALQAPNTGHSWQDGILN